MPNATITRGKARSRRRSQLIALGHLRPDLERAAKAGADIVRIDLEDGVPPEMKARARRIAALAINELDWGGAEVWIRLNDIRSGETAEDIEVLTASHPSAYVLTKVDSVEEMLALARLLDLAEPKYEVPRESTKMVAQIERIRGLNAAEQIAACHPRMIALTMGPNDLGKEYGYILDRTGPSLETLYAKSRCVLAARLAGIDAGDSPYWYNDDLMGCLRSTLTSLERGFTIKGSHSAVQIPIIHGVFEVAALAAAAGWKYTWEDHAR